MAGCASGPYHGGYGGYGYSDGYSPYVYGSPYQMYPGTPGGSIYFRDDDGRDRWHRRHEGDRDWRDGRDRDDHREWRDQNYDTRPWRGHREPGNE